MGKNHRHKKDLKAEKAKIKLKQSKTKFLPKGQNVTNTSFKIKQIVIQEQLKQRDSEEILSKRKLNMKDLLTRIKHYNENVRHTACEELTDMIKVYTKEIVQQHLFQICLSISSLMQDKEMKVRRAGIKCIDTILQYVSNRKLLPFFDVFATNLRCAMTNINKNIQEDSLLFLDCFIKTDCGLISKTSERLLPDFLSLISKLRSDSQLGRTLTLNLGSKMTSVAWRIKVLSRLHAVLRIILENEENGDHIHMSSRTIFDVTQTSVFPLYKENFKKSLDISSFDLSIPQSAAHKGLNTLNRHIIALIPLLYETWLEVMPDQKVQKSTSETTVLKEETAALLTCIMNTLNLLLHYVKKNENEEINVGKVFMTKEGRKFLTYLLHNFPYAQAGVRTKKPMDGSLKGLNFNCDPKCVHENLLIGFIYLVLHVNYTQHDVKNEMAIVISYITKLLFQRNSLGDENMQCLIEFLKECLGKNYYRWRKSGADLQIILENTILFYDNGKIAIQNKLALFQILSSVIDNEFLNKSVQYQNWLSGLSNVLCQTEVVDTIILALLELSKKNCSGFHSALVKKLPDILDNLDRLKIVLTSDSLLQNEETAKRNIANIFYYVPSFCKADLEIIQSYLRNQTQSSFKQYFQEVINLRQELKRQTD